MGRGDDLKTVMYCLLKLFMSSPKMQFSTDLRFELHRVIGLKFFVESCWVTASIMYITELTVKHYHYHKAAYLHRYFTNVLQGQETNHSR